jgi:hypothetical protein
MLEGTAGQRAFSSILGLYSFSLPARLKAYERQRAEHLGERLWIASGTGRTAAEEVLLAQVGVQASPDSLPFFRAALEANRARDPFQARRRRIAVASVAFIAYRTGNAEAHAQLKAWLEHPDVTVRTEAVLLFGRLHLEEGKKQRAAMAPLERVAQEDRAFTPRFLARSWLHTVGIPVRTEPPDSVYAFKASLGRVSRTVELTASQSLADLAEAILNAFHWDHDHLYEFALTGDLRDRRFVFPHADYGWPELDADGEQAPAEPDGPHELTGPPDPMSLPLGAFGFPRGHEFLFRYDFGDNHRFRVKVADIHAQRSPGAKYPRVVAETGNAPEQYPFFE